MTGWHLFLPVQYVRRTQFTFILRQDNMIYMIIQMTYGVFSSFRQWLKTPVSIFQILFNDDVLKAA